jgi:hypothetical protein
MSSPPATVANLDLTQVVEALGRNACNVTDAAQDLGVPASDLRRLMWSRPHLQDQAFEVVEARLDKAEKNIAEALHNEDSRRRDAASFFVVRNSVRAKRRGWITSSAAAVDLTIAAGPRREVVYSWRSGDAAADAAKVARLVEEGKQVISIGWGGSDDDGLELIERDGKAIPVPRYGDGRGDDRRVDYALEGEVATPAVLIEHAAAAEPVVVESEPDPAPEPVEPVVVESAAVRYERERVDAWIRNRLIAYPLASCLLCRKPIIAGQDWQEASNGEARARFHRDCHAQWRAEREAAARQALGLAG